MWLKLTLNFVKKKLTLNIMHLKLFCGSYVLPFLINWETYARKMFLRQEENAVQILANSFLKAHVRIITIPIGYFPFMVNIFSMSSMFGILLKFLENHYLHKVSVYFIMEVLHFDELLFSYSINTPSQVFWYLVRKALQLVPSNSETSPDTFDVAYLVLRLLPSKDGVVLRRLLMTAVSYPLRFLPYFFYVLLDFVTIPLWLSILIFLCLTAVSILVIDTWLF